MRNQKNITIPCMALLLILIFSGCVTRIALKESMREGQSAKVGIAVEELPRAGLFKRGSQGMLDVVINEVATSKLQKHLESTDLSGFLEVKEKFAVLIEDRGFIPEIIDEFIDIKTLPKTGGSLTGRDYRSLAETYGIDYLLLFRINAVGTVRKYYGILPVGPPRGTCVASGRLIQLETNEKNWSYGMRYSKSTVPVEGKWNNPPDYPELEEAIQKAIILAVEELEANFN